MAGSLCATEYLYIEDAQLTADQLGTEVQFNVVAHFDAMVSAFTLDFGSFDEEGNFVENVLPADLTISSYNVKLSSAKITYLYWDSDEEELVEDTCTPSIGVAQNNTRYIGITSAMDAEWAEIDGVPTNCGAIKWKPGEFNMLRVKFAVPADFKGAEIGLRSQPNCGNDPRGNTCEKNQVNIVTFNLTVEGGEPVLEDLTGTIVFGEVTEDGLLPISYTGEEDVTITVTLNGEAVEIVDGCIQLVEGNNIVAVTVTAEGYNDLAATYEGEWTKPEPPAPVQTEAPEITTEETEDAVIVTATGEGTVILYMDGEEVENPCTIMKGETEVTYTFTATAQAEGEELSEITELVVVVPAKEVGPEPPVVEHPGYWIVLCYADGKEEAFELAPGLNGDYVTALDATYPLFYDVANFYFLIDDVPYGAEVDETEAYLGESMMNPLTADNTNTYFVWVGYSYSVGIHIVLDQATGEVAGYTAYVAKGGPVSVDELNGNKTVAGVRYYNMAGQEMQEANGMTIVVTTYTDGTTSAVKVMK